MKRFLLCIAVLSFYVNLHAKVVITGQVTDETTSPIIGAVVKLVTQTTLITQTVTNNEGLFSNDKKITWYFFLSLHETI